MPVAPKKEEGFIGEKGVQMAADTEATGQKFGISRLARDQRLYRTAVGYLR